MIPISRLPSGMERPKRPKSGISATQGGHQVAQMLTIVSLDSAKTPSVTGSPLELRDENAGKTSAALEDPTKTTTDNISPHKAYFNDFFSAKNNTGNNPFIKISFRPFPRQIHYKTTVNSLKRNNQVKQ
jgi:hypothetical protein